MAGHLFVLRGDLASLACDAWLLPTDRGLNVTDSWWRNAALAPRLAAALARRPGKPGQPFRKAFQGGERAIPLDDIAGPRPFLTVIGAGGQPVEWYVEGVRAFLDTARSLDDAQRFLPKRARRLLALPVVGTGAGGAYWVAGEILEKLIPVLVDYAALHDVDIALVCWGAAHFAAAQAARRRLNETGGRRLWASLSPEMQREAEALARDAASHHLVLFLGAGVSMGAGLPSWRELLDELGRHAGLTEADLESFKTVSLLDRAQFVAEKLRQGNPDRNVGAAVKALLTKHVHHGLAHALLASLPVEETITTNYDTLFEQASEGAGHKGVRVLPYAPTRKGARWLLKMHGCVEHPDDIVLTREDYMRYVERNAALAGIVQAMLITKNMLFVGFSLEDDNFLRIVDAVRRAVRGPTAGTDAAEPEGGRLGYALMPRGHALLQELWSKDLPWLCPGGEDAKSEDGVRAIEIFLDLLTHHAASHGHLLDERFGDMLDAEERALRDALLTVAAGETRYRDIPAWGAVKALLGQLGYRPPGDGE